MESIKPCARGQPEYAFNDQHNRDGKVKTNSAEVCLVKKVLLTHTGLTKLHHPARKLWSHG